MGIDIKIPIGLLFSLLGVLLTIFGLVTSSQDIYSKSLNINVNLWVGAVMVVFGAIMLISSKGFLRKKKEND